MAPIDIYYIGLMQEKKSLYKVTKGVYGLPVCDKMGMLKKDRKCVIVQHIAEGKYECSCEIGSLYDYTEEICIHVKAALIFKIKRQILLNSLQKFVNLIKHLSLGYTLISVIPMVSLKKLKKL